jgi:hypothetical protein
MLRKIIAQPFCWISELTFRTKAFVARKRAVPLNFQPSQQNALYAVLRRKDPALKIMNIRSLILNTTERWKLETTNRNRKSWNPKKHCKSLERKWRQRLYLPWTEKQKNGAGTKTQCCKSKMTKKNKIRYRWLWIFHRNWTLPLWLI